MTTRSPGALDGLPELLAREVDALADLERRLRGLELLAGAGEERFVALAGDDVEAATERLAALELGRALTLSGAGIDPDVSADDLVSSLDEDAARGAVDLVGALRAGVARVALRRERVRDQLEAGHRHRDAQLEQLTGAAVTGVAV